MGIGKISLMTVPSQLLHDFCKLLNFSENSSFIYKLGILILIGCFETI